MAKAKLSIVVSGGQIQEVFSDDEVEVNIVDYDNESACVDDMQLDSCLLKDDRGNFVRVYQAVCLKNKFVPNDVSKLLRSLEV